MVVGASTAHAQFSPIRRSTSDTERFNSVSIQATNFNYGLGKSMIRPGNGMLAAVDFNKQTWGWGFWLATDSQTLVNHSLIVAPGVNETIDQTWGEAHYTYFFNSKYSKMPENTTLGAQLGYMWFHYKDADHSWIDLNLVGSMALDNNNNGKPPKVFLGLGLGYAAHLSQSIHDHENSELVDDEFLGFDNGKTKGGILWNASLSAEVMQNVSLTASYWRFDPTGPTNISRQSVGLSFKF